ncbi:MAG: phosphate acyltransferase, partial [Chloroflexota bacterium]|nr:phosphate acyltransferase [Chloroflexota bacterium]
MKIALDAMGGDRAPQEMVKGAAAAAREYKLEVLLVGQRALVEPEMEKHPSSRLSLVEAAEVVEMAESPTLALRQKKDTSIAVGMGLVKQGKASAF